MPSLFLSIYGGKSNPGVTVLSLKWYLSALSEQHQIPHVLEVGVFPVCSSLKLNSALFEWTSQKLVHRFLRTLAHYWLMGAFGISLGVL